MKNILITLVIICNFLYAAKENLSLNKEQLLQLKVKTIANETVIGSAVALSEKGKLITAYHVIDSAESIEAVDRAGKSFPVIIGKVSPDDDLAYLHIETQNQSFATISKDSPKWSEKIYVLGGDGTLVEGVISKLESQDNDIVINFEVPRGMSGGGLFNGRGELLGIVSRSSINEGISYAVSVNKFDRIKEKFTHQKALDYSSNNYNYSHCTNKSTIDNWNNLIKSDTIEIHELHAIFLGLCEKVKRKEITTEVANYLFLKHRDNLVNSKK